jgi:predicted small lipoprotein YifL
MIRVALALIVAMALAGSLAACGKKGSPEPPPGKESTYPKPYPSE